MDIKVSTYWNFLPRALFFPFGFLADLILTSVMSDEKAFSSSSVVSSGRFLTNRVLESAVLSLGACCSAGLASVFTGANSALAFLATGASFLATLTGLAGSSSSSSSF